MIERFYFIFVLKKERIDRLIAIRDDQLKIFEQMTMFQQRILCHRLPRLSVDMREMDDGEKNSNAKNKVIQEVKRRQLHIKLEQYEMQLLDYEQHFQKEFSDLEMSVWQQQHLNTKGE